MKPEKIYLVEFNRYTNPTHDTVSNRDEDWNMDEDFSTVKYLKIPEGGLLIPESDLMFYKQFGYGYKTIRLVGQMYLNPEELWKDATEGDKVAPLTVTAPVNKPEASEKKFGIRYLSTDSEPCDEPEDK